MDWENAKNPLLYFVLIIVPLGIILDYAILPNIDSGEMELVVVFLYFTILFCPTEYLYNADVNRAVRDGLTYAVILTILYRFYML